ncbi:alpha-actinin A, partial [Biomphalaria pfeifferi]
MRSPEGGADELLNLERCKGALQTILHETAEDDSLLSSVASCGSTALSRVILRKGLMKRSSGLTALITRAVTSALRVRWLTPATTVRMKRQRSRHRLERNLVNWRRRKRQLQRAVWMTLWGTRSLPSVAPTDRPPPALTKVHYPAGHLNLFGTNRTEKEAML